AESRHVVTVEQRPRVEHAGPRQAAPQLEHGADHRGPVQHGWPDREREEASPHRTRQLVAAEPGPDWPQKARVVHSPMPAASLQVRTKVVPVFGDEERVVSYLG